MVASLLSKQRLGSAIMGNAMMVLLARIAGIIFTLLGTKILEQQELGNILIGMGILMLASTISSLGFPGSVPHFVTVRLLEDDKRALSSMLYAAIVILLPISILVAFITYYNAEIIAINFYNEPSVTPVLIWMAWGVPFLVLSKVFTAALRGMNSTVHAAFIEGVLWRAVPLILLLSVAIFGIENYILIAQGVAITPVLMVAIGLFYLLPLLRNISFVCMPPLVDSELFSYTINSWITSLATLLRTRGDLILVGVFLSSAEVAVFAVGVTLVMIMQITNNIVSPAYRPMATRLIAEGNFETLIRYHKKIVRLNLLIVGPISVFLLFFAKPFVTTLFGADYAESAMVLQIGLLGVLPRAFMGPVNPTLLALGVAGIIRRIDVATTLIFILLISIFAPYANLVGAALAFSVTGFFQHVWKNIEVRKYIHVPWIPSPSIVPFISLLFVLAFAAQYLSETQLSLAYGWLIVLPIFLLLSLIFAFLVKQITVDEAKHIINLLGERFRAEVKAK